MFIWGWRVWMPFLLFSYVVLASGLLFLALSFWLFAFGSWLLDLCSWLLVSGSWLGLTLAPRLIARFAAGCLAFDGAACCKAPSRGSCCTARRLAMA